MSQSNPPHPRDAEATTPERATFPIQAAAHSHPSKGATVNRALYMAAYEVYAQVYGPQEALLVGGCRGGFGMGEMLAFLYARSFPRSEWRKRVNEAFENMDIGR